MLLLETLGGIPICAARRNVSSRSFDPEMGAPPSPPRRLWSQRFDKSRLRTQPRSAWPGFEFPPVIRSSTAFAHRAHPFGKQPDSNSLLQSADVRSSESGMQPVGRATMSSQCPQPSTTQWLYIKLRELHIEVIQNAMAEGAASGQGVKVVRRRAIRAARRCGA